MSESQQGQRFHRGPVQSILREILESRNFDVDSLSRELKVSKVSVSRWLKDFTTPRPNAEARLRQIHQSLTMQTHLFEELQLSASPTQNELLTRESIDETLRELREILHRRGRMSGRNEALEELSKLLFAHVMSTTSGGNGISRESILKRKTESNAAEELRGFVAATFRRHLPRALAHEMSPKDFELKISLQERLLAKEIIDCFERLAPKRLVPATAAVDGVDVLNEVFGKFLTSSFVDEKEFGQYLTPPEVVKFMVRLALQAMPPTELITICDSEKCSTFGVVLDPSCGVGSFLAELLRVLHSVVLRDHREAQARKWLNKMLSDVVVGIDKSERMIHLALTNMALFGFQAARLHLANSLARTGTDGELTASLEGKVRLILTNPPFGAEFKGEDLASYKIASEWTNRPPRKVDSEILFLERYVNWLSPGGQILAIIPDSILTNRGIFEDLRRRLGEVLDILSIVSLPVVTFEVAGTATKTSILHGRKRIKDEARRHTTYFATCHDVGYTVLTRQSHRTKLTNGRNELPKILEEYTAQESALVIGRRVAGVEELVRWDASYHASLPREVEQHLRSPLHNNVFVSDVASLSGERTDPRRWGTGTFPYIEISDVDSEALLAYPKDIECVGAPTRARKLVHAGDVLFSTVRPERRTVAVIREDQDGGVCSTGIAVLRPKGIHPLILGYLLKTDTVIAQVMRHKAGIAYPAIDEEALLTVMLPIGRKDIAELAKQAALVMAAEDQVSVLRKDLSVSLSMAVARWTPSTH